jgi:uncharacterized membrane protein
MVILSVHGGKMHNVKLIQRRFPKHGTIMIAALTIMSVLGIIGGFLLLVMPS